MIPRPTPIEGVEVEDETDFFNWYNPAKAHRVLTVNVPDPILKMKTIGRLIWWNEEQTIPQSIAYPLG